MRRAIVAAAVLVAIAAGLIATWLLVWGDDGTDGLAETTTSVTAATTTETAGTTSTPPTTTTLPSDLSPGRVDLIGVVVAVEAEPGWDTEPMTDCSDPRQGPRPEECPEIGPATLVLDTGERLYVPAGTPGGRWLWRMTRPVDAEHLPDRRAVIAAALWEDGSVKWVYVLQKVQIPRDEEPSHIVLPGGEVTALTPDGWVITEEGWEYHLADEVQTIGCSHLWGFTWTLAGPRPAPMMVHRARPAELRALWDGPQGTRLALDQIDYGTTRTVGDLECTDLLNRFHDPDPLGTLATARALWEAAAITDYQFRYSTGGAWGRWGGIWDITVRDGRGTAVKVEEGYSDEPPPATIEELFAFMEERLTTGPTWGCDDPMYWTALYDPDRGYPTSFYLDDPGCIDEEHGWWIEDFAEL